MQLNQVFSRLGPNIVNGGGGSVVGDKILLSEIYLKLQLLFIEEMLAKRLQIYCRDKKKVVMEYALRVLLNLQGNFRIVPSKPTQWA